MSFNKDSEKFDIFEQEVFDSETGSENSLDSLRSSDDETTTEKVKSKKGEGLKKEPKNKYGWAFFLFSLFSGLGLTATFDVPVFLFMGMGIGFLFFVDPIYEKVIKLLDRL